MVSPGLLYISTALVIKVTQLFRKATELFGVPSRVRSDKGGENIGVCEFIIRRRGINSGSHIAGKSTQNRKTVVKCV